MTPAPGRRWILLVLVAPILVAGAARSGASETPPSHAHAAAPPTLAESLTRFSADVWLRIALRPGNQACSPLCIHAALSMAAEGARGATWAELQRALGLPPAPALAEGWLGLRRQLDDVAQYDGRPLWTWTMAEALFPQQGCALDPAFLRCCSRQYGAVVAPVDFQAQLDAACGTIDAWVARATAGQIPSIVSKGMIDARCRLCLATAVHLEAHWEQPFSAAATTPSIFHRPGAADVRAPTMHMTFEQQYAEVDQAQVVSLPYLGGQLACLLVVPRRTDGLEGIERLLSGATLARIMDAHFTETLVQLALPRVHVAPANVVLDQPLRSLGMKRSFSIQDADFGGVMAEPFCLGHILHRCEVDMDEHGTLASAATVAYAWGGLIPAGTPVTVVAADHPYLMIIEHVPTRTILFLVRVSDPSA